jgi:hypothetical protein
MIEGKPPQLGHDKAWSMLNEWPQLHWDGPLFRRPLRHKVSLKADLWRAKPMGRAVSHIFNGFNLRVFSTLRPHPRPSITCRDMTCPLNFRISWFLFSRHPASQRKMWTFAPCENFPLYGMAGWTSWLMYSPYNIAMYSTPSTTQPICHCTTLSSSSLWLKHEICHFQYRESVSDSISVIGASNGRTMLTTFLINHHMHRYYHAATGDMV